MSTNLGTWRKALRWSKFGRAWGRLPAWWREPVVFALGTAFGILIAVAVPWERVAGGFIERRAQRTAMIPLILDARHLPLDYEQALACGASCLGRSVVWRVTMVTPDGGYVAGRPGWPFHWTNPQRVRAFSWGQGTSEVVARLGAVHEGKIDLTFVGLP